MGRLAKSSSAFSVTRAKAFEKIAKKLKDLHEEFANHGFRAGTIINDSTSEVQNGTLNVAPASSAMGAIFADEEYRDMMDILFSKYAPDGDTTHEGSLFVTNLACRQRS